jgi:hypothetical protein
MQAYKLLQAGARAGCTPAAHDQRLTLLCRLPAEHPSLFAAADPNDPKYIVALYDSGVYSSSKIQSGTPAWDAGRHLTSHAGYTVHALRQATHSSRGCVSTHELHQSVSNNPQRLPSGPPHCMQRLTRLPYSNSCCCRCAPVPSLLQRALQQLCGLMAPQNAPPPSPAPAGSI